MRLGDQVLRYTLCLVLGYEEGEVRIFAASIF